MAIVKTDYHQPDFYHFNSDSIMLVDYIKSNYPSQMIGRVLDFCCGVGVVALELSEYFEIQDIVFFDIQSEYEEFIKKNINLLDYQKDSVFVSSLDDLYSLDRSFDAIVINPPYFLESASRLPESTKRKIARFYKRGELEAIVRSALSQGAKGVKFFLCIKLDEHNRSELEFLRELESLEIKMVTLKKLTIFDITLTEDKLI